MKKMKKTLFFILLFFASFYVYAGAGELADAIAAGDSSKAVSFINGGETSGEDYGALLILAAKKGDAGAVRAIAAKYSYVNVKDSRCIDIVLTTNPSLSNS